MDNKQLWLVPIKSDKKLTTLIFTSRSLVSDEAGNSGEDSTSNRSVGLEDTDYAINKLPNSTKHHNSGAVNDESGSISHASLHSFSSNRSNSSLKKEDLKQALLSVMEKKDELEQQEKSLKLLLDQEVTRSADIR